MTYIFFGTPRFAAIILEKLIDASFIPTAVVCNPDKPVGRKQVMTAPEVKLLIARLQDCKIKVLQPESLKNQNPAFSREFGRSQNDPSNRCLTLTDSVADATHDYDFFIVAAYGKIIPPEILKIPRFGTIGIHPSLLPKYRGATPIQSAILNGDANTGTTLFLLDEQIDHGNIISNFQFPISNDDTYETLEQKLAELGAKLLIEFLTKLNQCFGSPTSKTLHQFLEVGLPEIEVKPLPQKEMEATYTKKFTTQDGFIKPADLEKAEKVGGEIAIQIERKIRALNLEPGVWTYFVKSEMGKVKWENKKRVKLLEAEIVDGKLKLKKIQVEGKKPMEIK